MWKPGVANTHTTNVFIPFFLVAAFMLGLCWAQKAAFLKFTARLWKQQQQQVVKTIKESYCCLVISSLTSAGGKEARSEGSAPPGDVCCGISAEGDVSLLPEPFMVRKLQSNENNTLLGGWKYKSLIVLAHWGKIHCFPLVPSWWRNWHAYVCTRSCMQTHTCIQRRPRNYTLYINADATPYRAASEMFKHILYMFSSTHSNTNTYTPGKVQPGRVWCGVRGLAEASQMIWLNLVQSRSTNPPLGASAASSWDSPPWTLHSS